MKPKFNPGREVMTRSVSNWAPKDPARYMGIIDCLRRHLSGDWGEVCPEDAQANEEGLKYGDRLNDGHSLVLERTCIDTRCWTSN